MLPARNTRLSWRPEAIAALLFLCFPALLVRAESSGGEARLASARVVEVTPGKIVTASILIANRSDADAVYEEEVALPSYWQRVSPVAAPMPLGPGEQQLRLVAFAVPATSPAGRFELTYALVNGRTRAPVASAALTVIVLPVVKLELVREDQIEMAIAGDTYEARLRLINRGNSRLKVSLGAVAVPETLVRLEPAEVWLDAASSQVVRAFVASDVELRKATTQVIQFKATAQAVVINVIPRITGDSDPYVRVPAQLRLISVAENGSIAAQAEFSGAGHFDEDRKHRIEYLFRGPSLARESVYGLTNEYRVSYSGPDLDLHLGDRNYALSPLTQRFNYGRGAAVDYRADSTSVGGFYMRTLERVRNYGTAGFYLRREFSPAVAVQANALYKSDTGLAQNGPVALFSLQPQFNFGRKMNLGLEYGLSTGGSGAAAHAHRVDAQGQLFENSTYSIERVHAGDRFFGYYHGTETTQATATFPIVGPLRGKMSFNQDARDSAVDSPRDRPLPPGVFLSRQSAYRPGLMLRVSPGTDTSLEYQNIERHATLQAGQVDSIEQSARLGLGHSRGRFSLQTFAELGVAENSGAGVPGGELGRERVNRYSTFLHFRPTPRQTYSIFGSTGASATLELIERSQSFGASAQWNISSRLSAALNLARNEYDSRTARVQDTATGNLNYILPNRNILTVQGRWMRNSLTRDSGKSLMVGYSIPLDLRASKKKSGGTIHGRIFAADEQPLPRVVVTANGMTAVTDRKGEFVFPSLTPGNYQLHVEQRSLGVDRVITEPGPLTIEVNKGAVAKLALGTVAPARVKVNVALYSSAPQLSAPGGSPEADRSYTRAAGLAGGLVELSNGRQVLRQTTDRDGEVLFEQVRPGKWTIRVYQNGVPEHHVLETPETELELKPGKLHETTVRVLPKFRPIQFIDGGRIAPK